MNWRGTADLTWEEREEFYKKEWDEIQRLENLLDSLIHVSRLESGMIQIQPEMGSLKKYIGTGCKQCVYESV